MAADVGGAASNATVGSALLPPCARESSDESIGEAPVAGVAVWVVVEAMGVNME